MSTKNSNIQNFYCSLSEIIILCVKSLQPFSPQLLDLICEPEFDVGKWEPIFEIHFGAPKLNENAITLTFGTVLSIVGVYTKVLNLQNYGFHELPLNSLPSPLDADAMHAANSTTSSVPISNNSIITSKRNFTKSLSFASVSSVNCPNELLSNLDGDLCLLALEHVLTLAASQSMLALKNPCMSSREKQLIRREITTELISYHEFVRKKILLDHREHKEMWHRRKHGLVLMDIPTKDNAAASTSSQAQLLSEINRKNSADLRKSMRVNVVRRQHLQQQQQQRTPTAAGSFEMTQVISPIGTSKQLHQQPVAAISSTPNFMRPPLRRPNEAETVLDQGKRVYIADEAYGTEDEEEEEEIEYFPPDDTNFSILPYVQMVEEDYLHFMSNLFSVICQSD